MQKGLILWILALGLAIHDVGHVGNYEHSNVVHLSWNTEWINHSLDGSLMFGHFRLIFADLSFYIGLKL
jgi:hypothetical protein